MKRETLRHPKTHDLASRLNCSRPAALGYLILLWDYTADVAITGAIGRWPDGAIARACDWPGSPEEFVSAMVDSRWIDRDEKHRLLIHDWPDHCERWVKAKMEKTGQTFARPTAQAIIDATTERSTVATTEGSTERSSPRDQTKPNQTKPNQGETVLQTEPKTTPPTSRGLACDFPELAPVAERIVANYQKTVKAATIGGKQNVIRCLGILGATEDQLRTATRNYAAVCDRENKETRYRKGAASFFGDDEIWREFLQMPPPTSHQAEAAQAVEKTRAMLAKADEVQKIKPGAFSDAANRRKTSEQ